MANDLCGRPMPAGLSLLGQRVMMEVRNSWMRNNNPEYIYARHPMPENQPRQDVNCIQSWNTQISNMPTQDLFNTNCINRYPDSNTAPRGESHRNINYGMFQAQQEPIRSNPAPSTQQFYHSQNKSNSSQLEISGSMAQESIACTQKSIMLFEDEDDRDRERSMGRATDEDHLSGDFYYLQDFEDDGIFRSVCDETDSPPIEFETQTNSPAFIFRPVVSGSKRNENSSVAQATDALMFKVPQLPLLTRAYGGIDSQDFHSSSERRQEETKQKTMAEPMVPFSTRDTRGKEKEYNLLDQCFQGNSQSTLSRIPTKFGNPLNNAFQNHTLMLPGREVGRNEDVNGGVCFSWEPVIDIEESMVLSEHKLNAISETNMNIGHVEVPDPHHSPPANRVDIKFISELLHKLESVAKDKSRQEAEEMDLKLDVNTIKESNGINVEAPTIEGTAVIADKQEKPLPNFYIFKTPLKRSKCDSELNRKVQKLGPASDDRVESGKCIDSNVKQIQRHNKENLQSRGYHNVHKQGVIISREYNNKYCLDDAERNDAKVEENKADSLPKLVVTILTEKNLFERETQLSACELDEVALTIMYKEGVSQLDAAQGVALVPCGLLFGLRTASATQFFFLRDLQTPWMPATLVIRFLSLLFARPCPKICVDAQAVFMYLIDKFTFSQEEVCSGDWVFEDPLVGGWLLDPDHPPTDFLSLAASLLGKQPSTNGSGHEQRACHLLLRLSRAAAAVSAKLHQAGLYQLFTGMEMKLVPVLAVMELRGIAVDTDKLQQMQALLESRLAEVTAQAYRAAGRKFALNSPAQLRALLYDELRLDKGLHIKSTAALGAKSTAEPMLLLLAPLHALPALVLRHRQLHKIKAAYVDGMLEHSNGGAIYTSWEQTSCATGRITCNSPNVQTIPRGPVPVCPPQLGIAEGTSAHGSLHMRSVFIPRAGFALVSADFCQVELRLFAHFAHDETLLHAFRQQGDIFQHLAALWLGPGEGDEDCARQREKTKRVVYAVMYGAGPVKLSEFLQVSVQQASSIIDSFLGLVPALRKFPQRVLEQCRLRGFLRSLSGRLRRFPLIGSPQPAVRKHAERQAMNFIIQGSAADVCKAAMLATEQCLRENAHLGARLLLQIHDELVWEVPRSNAQRFKELISEVMQDTNALCGEMGPLSVGLPVSVHEGDTWADMS